MPDLDWDPERARAFADRAVDLWEEFLERLPDLPVAGRWTAKEVRDAVAIDVPDEPMPDDALFAYLRDVIFELLRCCRDIRGSWPTSPARARCRARPPTCSRRG